MAFTKDVKSPRKRGETDTGTGEKKQQPASTQQKPSVNPGVSPQDKAYGSRVQAKYQNEQKSVAAKKQPFVVSNEEKARIRAQVQKGMAPGTSAQDQAYGNRIRAKAEAEKKSVAQKTAVAKPSAENKPAASTGKDYKTTLKENWSREQTKKATGASSAPKKNGNETVRKIEAGFSDGMSTANPSMGSKTTTRSSGSNKLKTKNARKEKTAGKSSKDRIAQAFNTATTQKSSNKKSSKKSGSKKRR